LIKDMIETITLQKIDQNQIDFHICTKKNDEKNKDKSCVCGWIHLFKECVYLVSVNRESKWEENIKIRNEIRQKLQKIHVWWIQSNDWSTLIY
jgi:hypothetical protein